MGGPQLWEKSLRKAAVLNPIDRIAEVLFGLIMVLTFTGTISVATDGRQEIRELLWAALGCNVAWGLVDAIMYLMNILIERGHSLMVIKKLHDTPDAGASRGIVRDEIQPGVAALLKDEEVDKIAARIREIPVPPKRALLSGADLVAGVQIFLLVFLCTLPVALPFALLNDVAVAMRASNGVALLLLFVGGFLLARYAGFRPVLTAIAYTLIGLALVSLTMALGG